MEPGSVTGSKLKQELDSWRNYSQALHNEDKEIFQRMISRLFPAYSDAIENSGRGYTAEALLFSLIISQQKTIDLLSKRLARLTEN